MSTELEHWERYCQTERGGEVRERSNDLRSPNEVPHILVPRRMISLADTANKTYTEPPSDQRKWLYAIPSEENSQRPDASGLNFQTEAQWTAYSIECNRVDTEMRIPTLNSSPRRLIMRRSSLKLQTFNNRRPRGLNEDTSENQSCKALKRKALISHKESQKGTLRNRTRELLQLVDRKFYLRPKELGACTLLSEYEKLHDELVEPFLHRRRTINLVPRKQKYHSGKAQQENFENPERGLQSTYRTSIQLSSRSKEIPKQSRYINRVSKFLDSDELKPRKGIYVTSRSPDVESVIRHSNTKLPFKHNLAAKVGKIVLSLKGKEPNNTKYRRRAQQPPTPITNGCCQ